MIGNVTVGGCCALKSIKILALRLNTMPHGHQIVAEGIRDTNPELEGPDFPERDTSSQLPVVKALFISLPTSKGSHLHCDLMAL